jgi:hypothetical protein
MRTIVDSSREEANARAARAEESINKWVIAQARRRAPMRYLGLLVVLIGLVYYATEYVWR